MTDSFNIKKYLAENDDPFLATLKKNQQKLTGFEPQFQPSPCTACDGTGSLTGDAFGDPCPHCDGGGELVEHNGDHYDDMEFGGGYGDEDFEPPTNMCPECEGDGTRYGDTCPRCGGHGEVHESSDEQNVEHSDQMDDEDYDVPAMEGTGLTAAQEVAQDMIDSGMSATSDENFNALYDVFMERYREGWGWPDQFREEVRAAYKAILKKKALSGSDFNAVNENAELNKLRVNAGMLLETVKQGKAPTAQLKGKEAIKSKGVKGYDDDHPASGKLVGEGEEDTLESILKNAGLNEEPGDWDHGYNYEGPQADDEFQRGWDDSKESNLDDEPDYENDGFVQDDNMGGGYDVSLEGKHIGNFADYDEAVAAIKAEAGPNYFPSIWFVNDHGNISPIIEESEQVSDEDYVEDNEYDDHKFGSGASSGHPGDAELEENPLAIASIAADLLSEYGEDEFERNDWEDQWDDEEEEDDYAWHSVTIHGDLPAQSYWNKTGQFNAKSEKLEELIPTSDEVEDHENNPALELFRRLGNIYHDVYNNGLWDEGHGQRGDEMEEVFNLGPGQRISADDLEEMVDDAVHDAWEEQMAKGTISETMSGAFATGPMVEDDDLPDAEKEALKQTFKDKRDKASAFGKGPYQKELDKLGEDEDDDLIGMGDMDKGDEITLTPGQIIQVDTALGGEAAVVAQRPGYVVVNLPKGGMKLLRDDEWWLGGEDDTGYDSDVVDVDYDEEEPEELAFEMYSQGYPGERFYNIGNREFESLQGYFPDAEAKYDSASQTAELRWEGGISNEISNKIDRFNSNWQTKSMAITEMQEDQAAVMGQHSQDDRQNNFFSKKNIGEASDWPKTKHRGIEIPGRFRSRYDVIPADADPKTYGLEPNVPQDKDAFKRQELGQELAGEEGINNYAIFIDGKHWKTVKNEGHAKAIVRTLTKKGTSAEYKFGAYPMDESITEISDIDIYLAKRAAARGDGAPDYGPLKAGETSRRHYGTVDKLSPEEEDDLPLELFAGEDMDEGKTRTYTGDLATTEVEPPYGGFSRLGMKDLAAWIKERKDYPRWAELVKKGKKVLAQKRSHAKFMKGRRPTATKYKYTIAKQVGGDDGYQWAVIDKRSGHTIINGLTKPEVKHYRDRAERDLAAKYEVSESSTFKKGYKNKGGAYNRPGSAKEKRAGGKHQRKNVDFWDEFSDSPPEVAQAIDKLADSPKGLPEAVDLEEATEAGFKLGRDQNGNTTLIISPEGEKGFSIQTNGNLYQTHRDAMSGNLDTDVAYLEAKDFIKQFGTERQKQILDRAADDFFGQASQEDMWGTNEGADDPKQLNLPLPAIQGNFDSWVEWAKAQGIDPTIEKYLDSKSEASLKHELEPGEEMIDEIETATDQLDTERAEQSRELGEPAQQPVDPDAELAGMQQIIKNMMTEPDQDMEDAIQNMAMANTDPEEAQLGDDEVAQLQQLLGLLK